MGKAIFYCSQCSKRLTDADLGSGNAFRVGDRVLCRDCAPADVRNTTSKKLPAVRPVPSGSTVDLKTPPAPVPPPESGRRKPLILVAVAAGVLVAGTLVLIRSRGSNEGSPPSQTVTPISPTIGKPPTPPAPDSVDTREVVAREDLEKAKAFAKAHPDDLSARMRAFTEVVWKWEGTEAGREAAREAAAIKSTLLQKVDDWMAELETAIKDLLAAKQYVAAAEKVQQLKASHDLPEWKLAAEKRASELYALGKRKADEEDGRKQPSERPEVKTPPKPLTEEGKAQLARWEAAAAKATARDYAGALADLERSLPALKDADVKAEAEEDAALLRKVGALLRDCLEELRKKPAGSGLDLSYRDAAGAAKRAIGVVAQIDVERVELRLGKTYEFIDWSDASAAFFAQLAPKEKADPATRTALCLLEGDVDAARSFQVALPAKWWTYAEGARAKIPKPDPAERSARNLFASAEQGYRSMDTRGAAIEGYRSLRADFAATALAKAYAERIARRAEAGKEYWIPPYAIRADGSFRLAKSGKLESTKDSEGAETLNNNADVDFAVLPGQTYRCWIWVGACCEETFLFFYQGTELTDTDPKTKKKVACEPGAGFVVTVKHSIRNLKKTHQDHKIKGAAVHPKTAARWEWVEVTLPKYTAPGAKSLRFLTNQAGFSIGGVLVSALRKLPPTEAELKDLDKARVLDEPPLQADPDLIAWWTFDEGRGSEAKDWSGNGHDGKLVGEVKWIEGKVGGGIHFDGGKSGIAVADAKDLRITGDLTVALWVRKSAEPADWACMLGRGTREQRNYGFWLDPRTPRYMWQQYDKPSGPASEINVYGNKLVEVGKWAHLAATIEQDQIRVYFDGELDGQGKRPLAPWSGEAPLGIGYAMMHSSLQGDLDDVRLYRRALTAGELLALYAQGR